MGSRAYRNILCCAISIRIATALSSVAPASAATAPPVPVDLQTAGTYTTTPVLSGVVQDANDGMVEGEIFLLDASGNPIGGSPTAIGGTLSGGAITYRVPDGVLSNGTTYRWYMKACDDQSNCSGQTPTQTFTINTAAAPPAVAGTSTATISGSAITNADAIVDPGACSGADCLVNSDSQLKVGSDGTHDWISSIKLDLSSIPADSRITSATLILTQTGCLNTPCPTGGWSESLDMRMADADVAAQLTGPQLAAAADQGAYLSVPGNQGSYDITSAVTAWFGGDVPNDGIILQPHVSDGTGGSYDSTRASVASSSLPQVVIKYAPPAPPSAPTSVTVTTGDGGVFVSWGDPAVQGDAGGITSYTVTAFNRFNQPVGIAIADGNSTVLDNLSNLTPIDIKVTATNAAGTGPAVTSGVIDPAAVAGSASYVQAVQQFLDARDTLRDGQNGTVAAAEATSSQAAMFGAQLAGEGPTDLAINSATQAEGATVNSDVNALSNALVVAAGTSVRVYVTDDNTFNCVTGAGTANAVTEPCEEYHHYLFTFSAGASPALIGYADADAASQPLTEATDTNASSTTLNDNPDTQLPTGVTLPAAQALTYTAPENTVENAPASIVDRQGTANWAKTKLHSSGHNGYSDDCTDFVSRAMHFGGGDPENYGWNWPLDHKDDHRWAKNWVAATYSWGGAYHLADHLWLNGSYYRKYLSSAQTGEVIFADWNGSSFNRISHAGIIWRVASNGFLMVLQHTNDRFEPLSFWFHANPHASVWVAIPNSS